DPRGSEYLTPGLGSLMSSITFSSRYNADLIDALYQRWRHDPFAVDESWRTFFEGFELGQAGKPSTVESSRQQTSVVRLIDAYRSLGHLCARLDPLSDPPPSSLIIDLADFGITGADLE